ncbi:MAG: EamA family transporter, partial [Rhodococcus sp. (in: high G+C Gram-positive bacteria)]
MTRHSSATPLRAPVLLERAGLWWGLLGVTAFSFTLPFTRVAVAGGMPPLFVGSGRAVVAALLAASALALT